LTPAYAAPDGKTLDDSRQRIESMTASQRKELERKYQAYQKLTPTEQAALRELHERLAADTKQGGQLAITMQRYANWVKNLDNAQRIKLHQATSPQQKRTEIQKILVADRERRLEEQRRMFNPLERFGLRALTMEQLAPIMSLLETDLRATGVLTPEMEQQLKAPQQQGIVRYFTLFAALAEYRVPREGPARDYRLSPELVSQIQEQLKDQQLANAITAAQKISGQPPSNPVIMLITGSVSAEIRKVLQRRGPPASELQAAIFRAMSPDEQQQLLNSTVEEQSGRFSFAAFFVMMRATGQPRERWGGQFGGPNGGNRSGNERPMREGGPEGGPPGRPMENQGGRPGDRRFGPGGNGNGPFPERKVPRKDERFGPPQD